MKNGLNNKVVRIIMRQKAIQINLTKKLVYKHKWNNLSFNLQNKIQNSSYKINNRKI